MMERKMNPKLEYLYKIAKTCNTKGEFKKKYPSEYRNAIKTDEYEKITSHMTNNRGKWTKETAIEIAKQFNSRWEFQKKAKGAYLYCFNNKFLDEACLHMPENLSVLYNSKEEIIQLARNFTTKTDFKNKHQGAYVRAIKEGFWKEASSHMKEMCHDWTNEELFEIA